MDRLRLRELVEAWRFIFIHMPFPFQGHAFLNRFESWIQHSHCRLKGSRWLSFSEEGWTIRLHSSKQIQIFTVEEGEWEV
jgi:hypothetical protein